MAFGVTSQVAEVDAVGGVVWEADLVRQGQRAPYLYRARRIASLYGRAPQMSR